MITFSQVVQNGDDEDGSENGSRDSLEIQAQVSLALKALASPPGNCDETVLLCTSSPNKEVTSRNVGNQRFPRLRKTNDCKQIKGWQSKFITPPPSSNDEADTTRDLLSPDKHILPDDVLLSSDPLALPPAASIRFAEPSPVKKRKRDDVEENLPKNSRKVSKTRSLDELCKHLGHVSHCINSKDILDINLKVLL